MKHLVRNLIFFFKERISILLLDHKSVKKVNLGCGSQKIPGYCGVDFGGKVDLKLNLDEGILPFKNSSVETVTCISAINYFTRRRGEEIIKEVYRILQPGGITRFGVQDSTLR